MRLYCTHLASITLRFSLRSSATINFGRSTSFWWAMGYITIGLGINLESLDSCLIEWINDFFQKYLDNWIQSFGLLLATMEIKLCLCIDSTADFTCHYIRLRKSKLVYKMCILKAPHMLLITISEFSKIVTTWISQIQSLTKAIIFELFSYINGYFRA